MPITLDAQGHIMRSPEDQERRDRLNRFYAYRELDPGYQELKAAEQATKDAMKAAFAVAYAARAAHMEAGKAASAYQRHLMAQMKAEEAQA